MPASDRPPATDSRITPPSEAPLRPASDAAATPRMPDAPSPSTVGTGTSAAPATPRLPRNVVLLGWVSFFADISGEMLYPLLPLFIVGVLGASATSLGWVEGVATAMVACLTAWAGWRSDRGPHGARRRVPWIRWGYGLPVLGKAIVAASVAWPMVMLGRAIDRFGKGLRGSPRDALIADAADPARRGQAFGFHRMMDTAGAFVGVLLSAFLLWVLGGSPSAAEAAAPAGATSQAWAFRTVFAIAAALGLAALLITFLVRESPGRADANRKPAAPEQTTAPDSVAGTKPPPPDARPTLGASPAPATNAPAWLGLPRAYWATTAILAVFALANSSDTFLLLRARDVGLAPWAVVLAYALYNAVYAACSYHAGLLSDRVGRWRILALGWVVYSLVYAGFAVAGAPGVWALFAIYGVSIALTDGVGKALIADVAPAHLRGRAMGVFYIASGFAALASSVIAGVLWDRVGHQWPFVVGSGVSFVAVLMALPRLRAAAK